MIDAALREDGRFEQLKMLGKGSFGCVCQARDVQKDEIVAIKLLPRAEVTKYVETEIINHSQMRHPHIIQFRDVFMTSTFICIVLEYAGTGTLHSYVRRHGFLKESVARWFFQQLAIAVDYCHRKGVANRDIKLENTLLHSVPHLPLPLVKMCDFGYSKEENKSAAKSKVGTLTYMAPEVLLNITGQTKYDGKIADIWSCGVMLYVMLTGRYPFDSPNTKGMVNSPSDFILMLEQMVGCRYEIPEELGLSEDCKDLLRRMLLPEPHKRITTEGILDHPWFNTNLPPEAATMNDRCLLLPPLPGVPCPEVIWQMVLAARPVCSSSSVGGSGATSSTGKGSSSSSSDTRMQTSANYGAQPIQPAAAAMAPQMMLQQHPQHMQHPQHQQHQLQHHQHHMQMMWQQQQPMAAAYMHQPLDGQQQQQQHYPHI